jgi:adenylate cyclase
VSLILEQERLTVQLGHGELMTGAEASAWVVNNQALVQGIFTFFGLMLILPAMMSALTRFSSSVVERIGPLQDGFRVVAQGDLETELAETGAREFKELAQHFNLMTAKLRDSKRLERTFGQYVSPQLLDRITATHGVSQISGETRNGSVLFADIRGFTHMTETHGAEVVVDILNRYFGEVVSVINDHEGYLDKFIGDEVFVVYNGPIDQPDHIERAVRCAIAILERVAEMNKKGAFDVVGTLGVGAGVATGTMVVGNVGSSQHLEYTVVGDAVNVAARLTGIAAAGQVLISPDTANHLPDDLLSQPLSEVTLKGKTNPIVPHQALRRAIVKKS